MSRTIEEKSMATGISGTNNLVIGDMIVIGQQNNQNILTSNSLQETSVWFEVRKPVESFTGRKRELENLHKEVQCNLGKNKYKLTVISQMTCISGLGGIGKSEMVRMYARQHCEDYDGNVIWINAETYGMLTGSFYRLAKDKLNIPTRSIDDQEKDINSIVQEVYKYFSKRKSLFIFDNANKLRTENKEYEGIDKFLPYFQSIDDNEPYIIITSRNQKWGKNIKVISIDTLTEEEAVEFIKKELKVSDESKGKEIIKLAQTLQYYPLALQQAVAYIKHKDEKLKNVERKFEIIDYLKRYEENAQKFLKKRFPEDCNNCYIKTTFITWEVTIEKIKKNKYGQQALEILETMAYLGPDNIPIKIYLELVNGDIEKLGSILQLPAQYSMVQLEHGALNIHRLVQQVIRLKLKEQQKETETIRKAIKLLKIPIKERNIESSRYLPHAISTWNYASKDIKLLSINEFNEFSSLITKNLIHHGRYQEAYTFSIQTLKLLKSILRLEDMSTLNTEYNISLALSNEDKHEIFHPDTLITRHYIALVLEKQGKYDEALGIYQKVLNKQERVLGGEHPDTLTTRHNIASVLNNQGKYYEALGIYQEVFNIQRSVLGEEHLDTLMTRHEIALVLHKQGKHDEALGIYKKVFNIQERVLGGEHPNTLMTKHNIASMLYKQGIYDEALGISQEVFNIEERVLGGEHPDTLSTRHNIASVLDTQGKYDEALLIYQEVLNIKKRVLGEEHLDNLMTRHNIALVLHKQGKCDEALGIYQEVFNIKERILGGEHPDTLMTKHNIASVLDIQGKYDEALAIYQEVFNIQRSVLGEEHLDTVMTRHYIAFVLHKQGKYYEALGIYQEVLNIRERVLCGEHPSTLMTRHNIALVLDRQGKHNQALVIYQEVLNILERVLGGEHPDTLMTRHNIASVLDKQGKYEYALRIYQEVFNKQERVLGEEHLDTLMTRHNIALVLHKQGKYDEALGVNQEVFNIQERVLGGEHPSTLMTKHNIALMLDHQGKPENALGIYQDVLNVLERVLGGEHPDTLMTRHNIASVLDKQGKYNEALKIYQEVFNIKERVLGVEHPDTLTTRHNIASVLHKQGKYDEALEIYREVFNIEERVLGVEHPSTLTTRQNIASLLVNQSKYDEVLKGRLISTKRAIVGCSVV